MVKSVYVHIPFCKQKCLYCDFNSYANKELIVDKYIDALILEIEEYDFDRKLETIYIGGGTPSHIDEKFISKIMSVLPRAKEVTIEVNPGTATSKKFETYKKAGINRMSIGLQSTDDKILKNIGRIHNLNDFENTYLMARNAGFDNINVDLIEGLPNQTFEKYREGVDYLIGENPEHISCYSLILHDNNIFENLPSDEEERKMYYYLKEAMKENGYIHYEISNFSKKGKQSHHNLVYWNQGEYIGFGAGASSYINGVRSTNVCSIEEYIDKITNNEEISVIEEVQSESDKLNEYIILQLRLIEGINIKYANDKFNTDILKKYNAQFEKLKKFGLIEIDENIYLTSKGLDLANIVWEEFV